MVVVAGPAGCELDKMADRLLDWFSVLMEQAGGAGSAGGVGAAARGACEWDGERPRAARGSEMKAIWLTRSFY